MTRNKPKKSIAQQRRELAERVKAVRVLLGMNQTKLAAAIGVARQTVNRWENAAHVIENWRGYYRYRESLDKFKKFEAQVRKKAKR